MAFKWFKKKKKQDTPQPPEQPPEPQAPALPEETRTERQADIAALQPEVEPEKAPQPAPRAGEPPAAPVPPADAPAPKIGLFKRLRKRMSKTRKGLSSGLENVFAGKKALTEELLEELEELLITSDMGVETTMDLIDQIRKKAKKVSTVQELTSVLKDSIVARLHPEPADTSSPAAKPHVIMVIGVNGVGKTTTIGKLAARFTADGKKVLIVAADTFRAAAIEQLTIWAERAGTDIVKHKANSDPAAVAFDGVEAALARGIDVVIVDTAGRLHTKVNLMEELKKIKRALSKKLPDAPHETLLVLDATTGQNAVSQAKQFNDALEISSLALTKLDGTAKGGIVVSICDTLQIPLKYIGIGEQIEDLQDFDAARFVDALFE